MGTDKSKGNDQANDSKRRGASKKQKVKRPMQKTMLEFPRSTLYKPFTGQLPDPKTFLSNISEAFKDLPDDEKPLITKMGLSSDVEMVNCAFGLVPKGCPLSYQCPEPSSRDYSPHGDAPPPPALPLASHVVEKVWPPPYLKDKDKLYMVTLETSWEAAHGLECSTRGSTDALEGLQRLRITDRFREICHLKAGRSHGEHLAFKMQRGPPATPAFKRDRAQRPEALREYCKHVFVNWSPCGLVVHPDAPWLGAVPDGLVYDPSEKPRYGLAHVRCPKARSFVDCRFLDFQFGVLELKKSHPYYWQIQGEMLVTGMAWCDFVVYTEDDILVQRIYRNQAMMFSMKPKLDNFFFHFYLPGLTAV